MSGEEKNVPAESKEAQTPTQNDSKKPAEEEKEKEKEKCEQDKSAEETEVPQTPTPQPAAKPSVYKADYEKDVVYLYQFSRTPLVPSLSPFCFKVETWLRLAGLKYENVDHKMKFRSKKGQLPFIELNGEEIADSTIILKELAHRFDKDLDIGLSKDQKNVSHAMISMIENHFVWVVSWWRTKYPDNVIKGYRMSLQHALGSKLPNGILNLIFKFTFVRKGAKKVKAQGIGVHKPEEIIEFGQNDLRVLSDLLADKPFFFGDEPTTLDIVAFASLAQVYFIDKEVQFQLRDFMIDNCPNLVGHVNRMKERCYPDWDEIGKTLDLNSHLPKPPPEEKETKTKEEEKKKEKEEKEGDKEIEKEVEKEIEKEKSEKEEKEVEKEVEENKQKEEKEAK